MARIVYLPAQLQGAGVRGPDLRRPKTFRGYQRFAQSYLQFQLLSGSLLGLGELTSEFQPFAQMSDCLQVG
jgi:hypothetical protein